MNNASKLCFSLEVKWVMSDSTSWWNYVPHGAIIPECHLEGAKKDKETGELRATSTGLEYGGKVAESVLLDWASILDIQVTGRIDRKVSAMRVATMGPLALAAKKKVESTTVTVTSTNRSATFTTDSALADVEGRIAPVIALLRSHRAQAAAPTSSPPSGVTSATQALDAIRPVDPAQTAAAADETVDTEIDEGSDDENVEVDDETAVTVDSSPPSIGSAPPTGPWWTGVPPSELRDVSYVKGNATHKGTFKVTGDGLAWEGGKRAYVRIPWTGVRNVSLATAYVRRGKYVPGAYLPGAVGEVVNVARRMHNVSATQRVPACIITLQDGRGQMYRFRTLHSLDETMAVLRPTLARFQAYRSAQQAAALPTQQVPPVNAPAGGIADELKKLAELRDAGILSIEEFAAQKAKLLG